MKENELGVDLQKVGLQNPEDNMSARITQSGRQVVKILTDNGTKKYRATRYLNGTIVQTKTTKIQ